MTATLGCEQEYFLVDRAQVSLRPDLTLTRAHAARRGVARGTSSSRTTTSASIPPRVIAFMEELEYELYRLGIPMRTRHNEVAPMQFEMAPIFEDVNLGERPQRADHGHRAQGRAAARLRVRCSTRSRSPGINGSGKHCNWSMSTDRGENLLEPGQDAAPEPALPRVPRGLPEGRARSLGGAALLGRRARTTTCGSAPTRRRRRSSACSSATS